MVAKGKKQGFAIKDVVPYDGKHLWSGWKVELCTSSEKKMGKGLCRNERNNSRPGCSSMCANREENGASALANFGTPYEKKTEIQKGTTKTGKRSSSEEGKGVIATSRTTAEEE